MKSGIYKITNILNHKFYIGSSKDIEYRWEEHKKYLTGGYHDNPKLQNAWNKYGEDKFLFEIIEETKPDQSILFDRENYHLSKLKPFERNVGYNICPTAQGGDNITHHPNRDDFIAKMKIINAGERNGMFGKKHSEKAVGDMKKKSIGRYTLDWFMGKYGQIEGEKKFQERRIMLMTRKTNYERPISSLMTFKGRKHKPNLEEKRIKTKLYFKNHWNEFVDLVQSRKYTQRQLSEMLNISRPTLKMKMKQIS